MGKSHCCDESGLKKGPWTPEEDQKLVQFIQEHGHGSWRALPTLAGLNRCGKSSRLRWTNYLRPGIKRGNFSQKEEQTILHLHSVLGNKYNSSSNSLIYDHVHFYLYACFEYQKLTRLICNFKMISDCNTSKRTN
ncbi:hypothetical protein ACLB2K_050991 [Fragaria x ananassa]